MPETAPGQPLISVVLPTYNARPHIENTWSQIAPFIASKHGLWEALFVCDGCSDGSDAELERRAADTNGLIRVVRYTRNRGKGYAVRLGLQRARGQYRIFTDFDLAYRLDMVEALADQLVSGLDVVIASRAHRESEVVAPPEMHGYLRRRKIQSAVFSAIARLLLGIRQRDPQAGLKGLSARAASTLLRHVRCTGFGFDCDLLVACRYFGIAVREMPVRVVYEDSGSTTRLSSSLKMIRELYRIRRRWARACAGRAWKRPFCRRRPALPMHPSKIQVHSSFPERARKYADAAQRIHVSDLPGADPLS